MTPLVSARPWVYLWSVYWDATVGLELAGNNAAAVTAPAEDVAATIADVSTVLWWWYGRGECAYISEGFGTAPAAVASSASQLLLSLIRSFLRQDRVLWHLPLSPWIANEKK